MVIPRLRQASRVWSGILDSEGRVIAERPGWFVGFLKSDRRNLITPDVEECMSTLLVIGKK